MVTPGRGMGGSGERDPVVMGRARIPHVEEYYDRLVYELDPLGAYRMSANQRLPHVTINRQGYRGTPWTGEETVLLLGDSVSFGVGASGDEATLARFLESRTGHRVADASVRAYRVFQHFLQLPRLLEQLPRLSHVLLWCGYADLLYWVMTGGCVQGAFQLEWKYRAGPSQQTAPASGWRTRLRLPQAAEILGRWLAGAPPTFTRETGTLEELVSHTAAYARGIHAVCAARRIGMTLLLQPFVRSRPSAGPLRQLADLCEVKTRAKCGRGWYEAAPRFVEQLLAALSRCEPLACVDCQDLVREEDFFDQAHLSEDALRRVTQGLVGEGRLRIAEGHGRAGLLATRQHAMAAAEG